MTREWQEGDIVVVNDVRAIKAGSVEPCKWTGRGTIDMVQYGGDYIRVIGPPYFAWVNRDAFEQVQLVTAAPTVPVLE